MKFILAILAIFGIFGLISFSAVSVQAEDFDNEELHYEQGYAGYADPLEGVNRGITKFNNAVDFVIIDPIILTYRTLVPEYGRNVVTNVLRNLGSPINFAHQVLQGDISGSGTTLFRFVVNSLAGFGGILDVASWEGIEYEVEDLGQTLATWGVPDGPYIVLPFFGPASLRDAIGYGVDAYLDPLNRYALNTEEEALAYSYSGANYLDARNQLYSVQKDLKENSLDYYSALKSVVYQNRQALIDDRNSRRNTSVFAAQIPDYDDDF